MPPGQLHSSRSSTESGMPVYSVRSHASSSHFVNSARNGAFWSTPRDKSFTRNGALTQSSYQSHNLASYAPSSSASCSWSPPSSTSLTEYMHATNTHGRRNFFAVKTSSEKMKIMSAIIIVFIISTITITFYLG